MIEILLMAILSMWCFCLGFWVRGRKSDYGSKIIARLAYDVIRHEKFLPPDQVMTATAEMMIKGKEYRLSLTRKAEVAAYRDMELNSR